MFTRSNLPFLTHEPAKKFRGWLLVLFTFVLVITSCKSGQTGSSNPPPDVPLVAEVVLSTQSYDEEILGEFTIAKTAVVTIYYTIPNLNATTFDLSLKDESDESIVILHSENFRTDQYGGGTWQKNLLAGTYRLALTADSDAGDLTVYWEIPNSFSK